MKLLKKLKVLTYLEKIAEVVQKPVDLIIIEFNQLQGAFGVLQQGTFSIKLAQTEEEKKAAPRQTWDTGEVAHFSLVQLPGCCGVVVSTGAAVSDKFRKLGIGKLLCEMRSHIATRWGYSLMLCTDLVSNKPQQAILKSLGWKENLRFLNSRTNNMLALHTITPRASKNYQLGFELPYETHDDDGRKAK